MPKAGWKKNPETGKFEPPPAGVEAPRKRIDPDDGPIDGDYRLDSVVNKEKGKRYYLLDDDDAVVKMAQGARPVERREGAAQPLFDRGSASDSGYKVRNLRLFEMPEHLAARVDSQITSEAEARMALVRNEARRSPGGEFVETNV